MSHGSSELAELGLAVKRVQWHHHRELDRRLTAIGGSLAQWDALRQIELNPDASMHRLADLTFQSDQSFGALANRMVDRGFIERLQGPGRAQRHALTERGRQLLRQGEKEYLQVLATSFAPLSLVERKLLLELLSRVGDLT
jgi:DNA-binding MarR family transcriptional regulator